MNIRSTHATRVAKWIAASLVVLLLIAVVAGIFVLRSSSFHKYVLAKIVAEGSDATGGRLEVQNFDFRWHGLTADLYGIVLHGTEGLGEPPLLQADRLTVGLKILSLMGRKVNLAELIVEHPVVHLQIHSDGQTNLPQPKSKAQSGLSKSIFDLAVGHVAIERGEIYYNDRKASIDANVRDLGSSVSFDQPQTRYVGSISYNDGTIFYPQLPSWRHSLHARFAMTPTSFSVDPLDLRMGSSRVTIKAGLSNYESPEVAGTYEILLHAQDFNGLLKPAGTADGEVALNGKLNYKDSPGQGLLKSITTDGQLNGKMLGFASPQGEIELRSIAGGYSLAKGDLQARNLRVKTLGGELRAELDVKHLDSTPASTVHASLRGISLQAARFSLKAASARNAPVTGSVDGKLDATWVGAFDNLEAHSDLTMRGALANSSASSVPLVGIFHATYDGATGTLGLRQSEIHTPESSLTADGIVGSHSSLRIQATSRDLRELQSIASVFRGSSDNAAVPATRVPNIRGSASLSAEIQGSLQQPRINTQITATDLQVEHSRWSSVEVTAQANPSQVTIQKARLINARQGRVDLSGQVELHDWSYSKASAIVLKLSAEKLALLELQEFAGSAYPVTGDVSANVSLHGTQSNPSGSGSLRVANAKAYDEPIESVTAEFNANGETIDSKANIKIAAGAVDAHLAFTPRTRAYVVQVDALSLSLQKLKAIQDRSIDVNGICKIVASGKGTLDDPQLQATIDVPRLRFRDNTASGIKAQVDVANQRANLTLNSDVAEAQIKAHGTVELTGNYYTVASLDTSNFPLAPLLSAYTSLPSGFHGQTELHATLKGPLKDRTQIEAHVEIPTLSAGVDTLQIANSGPIRADYRNSVVIIQPSELAGTGTSLHFEGRIPVNAANAMSVTAKGSADMRLLRIVNPDVRSSGTVAIDVRAEGSTQNPSLAGEIKIQKVALSTVASPLGVDQLNGTLNLTANRIQIVNLTGQLGGGDISAGGAIDYRPQVGFNLSLNSKSVRLRYPVGVRSILSSDLTLTGTPQSADLKGRVLIDAVSFTQEFDLSKFLNQFGGVSVPSSGDSLADHINLDVSVQSTDALAASSSALSLEGQANLRAIGTVSNPVIVGRADLTSGELFFLNKRYQLERGIINLINPNETEPVVNLLLTTTISQYNLSLTVVGPIDKLRTSYVSDPPLPTVDVINLIARGQTTEDTSSTSNLDANSVIAQGVASQLSSNVSKLAGLSSLQIDPTLGGNSRNPSARVAIQQRVSRSFVFTFSTDVTNPGNEIVQGEYQLNKHWSVSGTRDEAGGVAFDGRYHTTF